MQLAVGPVTQHYIDANGRNGRGIRIAGRAEQLQDRQIVGGSGYAGTAATVVRIERDRVDKGRAVGG